MQPPATGGLCGTHTLLLLNVRCERAANPSYESQFEYYGLLPAIEDAAHTHQLALYL